MNTYLKYQPPAIQFLSFLMLAAGFFFIDFLIASYFFKDLYALLQDKTAAIPSHFTARFKWGQVLTSTVSFIIPAFLFGYFSSPRALPYIGVQKTVSPVLLFASVLLLFCVQPFVGWLGEINGRMNFGEMQKVLLEKEAIYNRVFKVFLQMNSVGDLLLNLLIMALLPAIGEEVFFRGALQKALHRLSNNPWVAIIVTSAVFGLLHGTFFKLLPIFTLGLLLSTVYHVTRNLWYTIIIHFVNNAFAVFAVYYANSSEIMKKLSNDDISVSVFVAAASMLISLGIIYFIKKKSDEVLPEIVTNEDNDYIA
ncbi:MAG: family intrarane metalloprotease [Segetibacter sp.]|nr:family intrarane metalloprotease [Segetibacter sp.]